jgi:hypothetical protein
MSKSKLTICLICIYAIILPTNISGDLSKFQYDIIELAYTNGFLRGMSIDEDTINELLKDKEKLNDFARKEAREYMDKVVALNQANPNLEEKETEKSKKKQPADVSNSISF